MVICQFCKKKVLLDKPGTVSCPCGRSQWVIEHGYQEVEKK